MNILWEMKENTKGHLQPFIFMEYPKMTHSTHEKGFIALMRYRKRTQNVITNGYRTSLVVKTETKLGVEIGKVRKCLPIAPDLQ